MDDRELKRCPFCGSNARVAIRKPYGCPPDLFKVKCTQCSCGTEWIPDPDKPIDLWNSRVETAASVPSDTKKEYHLYLYVPSDINDLHMILTISGVDTAIALEECINTTQVVTCRTDLFDKGYRIFVHPNAHDRFEITLGKCERTSREIKRGNCLWKMILAGEFDINSTSSSSQSQSVCDSCRYKDKSDEYTKVCRECRECMRGEDWIDNKF